MQSTLIRLDSGQVRFRPNPFTPRIQLGQLFTRHLTEVSNNEVPEYLNFELIDSILPVAVRGKKTIHHLQSSPALRRTKKDTKSAMCQFFVPFPLSLR